MDNGSVMRLMDPCYVSLPSEAEDVRRFLTVHDRQVQFAMSRMRNNRYWRQNNPEEWTEKYEDLKAKLKRCVIERFPDGTPVTYSGLWKDLQQRFGWPVEGLEAPDADVRMIPWAKMPPEPRYYQNDAANALMRVRHGAIELPTGSGKSLVLQKIAHDRPVKTVIVTPSAAITDQLFRSFTDSFGSKYVGKYGDGSKNYAKLFTVAVAQSLTRLSPEDQAWHVLSSAQQVLWDESHTTAAETFDRVCTGLLRQCPYRYFVSATQLRTDGCELVLKGITGPIVYRKHFRELVQEGYLAQPRVKMLTVPSSGGIIGLRDVKEETRRHLYENPNVLAAAAKTASKMINGLNRQVVILIEEFQQFHVLKNHLTVPFTFVHGGASKEAKKYLEPQYYDCDAEQAVRDFNDGNIKCLIGTSAISTGVDLQPTGCLIYLQGGTSEIKVRQAIGRGTRIVPGKKDFFVVDFKIEGSEAMERHADARMEIYRDMTDDVQEARM